LQNPLTDVELVRKSTADELAEKADASDAMLSFGSAALMHAHSKHGGGGARKAIAGSASCKKEPTAKHLLK
jgi:hypothetical protein